MEKNLKKYISEEAKPKTRATINSFRSFGYNLPKAIADIVDNSISASANDIWIYYNWEGIDSFITITDNGFGMELSTLIEAMTPGSKDPHETRENYDLGRFGMGLKTASFSQCKSLSVISKTNSTKVNYRTWDLDFVNDNGTWHLLEYLPEQKWLEIINEFSSGTSVIWHKLDRIIGDVVQEDDIAKKNFYSKFEEVENYLSLAFHRYLEKGKINIYINERKITPWDPFLKGQDGGQVFNEEKFDGDVKIKGYILPHHSKLSAEKQKEAEGPYGWLHSQGFYVYRNERLLLYGSWLGLYQKMEHFKLARIMLDISNRFDSDWKIDIKKSQAYPPDYIISEIKRIASFVRTKSKEVYRFRGKEYKHKDNSLSSYKPMWKMIEDRESIKYKIDNDHPIVKKLIENSYQSETEIKKVFDFISESLPIELIIENHNEKHEKQEERKEAYELDKGTIELAVELFNFYKKNGLSTKNAIGEVLNTEPFGNYPELENYLKND